MFTQWPILLSVMIPFLLLTFLNGKANADAGGMDDVITQLKGGASNLKKVSADKLPARFLADMGIKPREVSVAAASPAPAAAAAPAASTRSNARRVSTRTTTTTTTTTETLSRRKVTFVEDVDDMLEFTGIIWPKGKYGVYMDVKDFEMSDEEKVTTRSAKPKVLDTKEDGKFVAKFTVPFSKKDPDSVFLHIFGGKKEPHVYLDLPGVRWNDVYIFDLNRTEVIAVRPRKVEDELKKLENRDKPPVKKEEPKPQTMTKAFAGLVWPPTADKYTLHVSPRDFDLDPRGGAVKKRNFHPDPTKTETNAKGMFDVKLVLTERAESLYVWAANAKGARKLFVIPAPDLDGTTKYALDMRTSKAEPFQRLENVLKKLKADGMINNEQIPSGPPKKVEQKPAEPAKHAPSSDMLNSIKAMVDDLGKALEKKIEQQHAKLKQDLENELEERVGKKLVTVGKRLGLVDDTLKDMHKKLPREIEEVIGAEFDVLYKKKLIGKLDGKA
uniref:Uncharacterized protein n=1 Tax=Globodera rostochiensis TaxID=31243 RepID=A0A914IG61_GLORO